LEAKLEVLEVKLKASMANGQVKLGANLEAKTLDLSLKAKYIGQASLEDKLA